MIETNLSDGKYPIELTVKDHERNELVNDAVISS